jgi:DNA-binding FadR family transcriptional regulator
MNDPADRTRIYARVSSDLATRIREGEFKVGGRLPAERELALAYKVSRPTIREAIIALEVDGQVEVRQGSGVYVTARKPRGGRPRETDIGPFELLEARRAIEGEACALAATLVSDEDLATLSDLVAEMQSENLHDDIGQSEKADRRFHMLIAEATRNSAMVAAVDMLWNVRARSPQSQMLTRKAHAAGVMPRVDEHSLILEALVARDPEGARAAMRAHLTRVLETLLQVTEVEEIERARERVAVHRRRYALAE